MSFPGGSVVSLPVEDMVSAPGSGRSPVEGNDNLLSILAWEILWTEEPGRLHIVHGVAKSLTQLSN